MRNRSLFVLVAGLLAFLLLTACQKEAPPLKIGHVGGLTGRVAGLGVAGRDGLQLAVEERNNAGGIGGRKVELVSRDDKQDVEAGKRAVQELIDAGVVGIVGPMTSAMAKEMQPIANRNQVPLISPSVTSNLFNDQDDYFFRMTMPLKINARKLAESMLARGLKSFAVSVDMNNAAYTEDWLTSFQQPFEAGGGRIVVVERFKSGSEGGFLPLAERLLKGKPDALLLLSGAMDTALVSQQVRKLGSTVPLFTCEWAFTSDVINFGGATVEDLRSYVTYNPGSTTPEHQAFIVKFEKRFGYKPSFAAVLSYEAGTFLLAGLERNPARENLKEALVGIGTIKGLQGEVRVNRFGDPERQTFLASIRNGQFVAIE